MGILIDDARLIGWAVSQQGVPLGRAVTIGRQNFYVAREDREELARGIGRRLSEPAVREMLEDPYVDSWLRLLGATTVDSLDASNYEGATLIHDLNEPLPDSWSQQFDFVLDSGSLEHVFDVRRSFSALLALARTNGHVMLNSPANNLMGHGFYQFSPELFFRVFSESNGYLTKHVIVREEFRDATWYKVSDPAQVGGRVELLTDLPVTLTALAQRVHVCPLWQSPVQQSDYSAMWSVGAPSAQVIPRVSRLAPIRKWLMRTSPSAALALRRWRFLRQQRRDRTRTLSNRSFYKPIPAPGTPTLEVGSEPGAVQDAQSKG